MSQLIDVKSLVAELTSNKGDCGKRIQDDGHKIAQEICESNRKIFELVKELDPLLTSGDHELRLKGVKLLENVITKLKPDCLNTKEIETLADFLRLRVVDHKSMMDSALDCLFFFDSCHDKPDRYAKDLLRFLKEDVSKKNLDIPTRRLIYQQLHKLVIEKHDRGLMLDSDLIYTIIHFFEDENNPLNLILCFEVITYILKNFQELEPYIDEIFEWLTSYYPIDYTPNETDSTQVASQQDLVNGLYNCFYTNPLMADNLMTLLLEKLDSSIMNTKLESLECLIKCYQIFPLSSLKSYTSTLWTSIRMECLKKDGQVDHTLQEACYRTLSALSRKLDEDPEEYFVFVCDLYEELSIALRKPEMELGDPAMKLLIHAAIPELKGFNYILSKTTPIAKNAIENSELRPLANLAILIDNISLHHPDKRLNDDVLKQLDELASRATDFLSSHEHPMKFLRAILNCKIELTEKVLTDLVSKLFVSYTEIPPAICEDCLAYIFMHYNRLDVIFDEQGVCSDQSLKWLASQITRYAALSSNIAATLPILKKFRIYLAVVIKKLEYLSQIEFTQSLNDTELNDFLVKLREFAVHLKVDPDIINKVGAIHGLSMNKPEVEYTHCTKEFCISDFCQKLNPTNLNDVQTSSDLYLPIVRYVIKANVMRNSEFSFALTNLALNFTISENIRLGLALEGAKIFSFVQDNRYLSQIMARDGSGIKRFNMFTFYKQKFYRQSLKEVRIRYEKMDDQTRKCLLIVCLAAQLPHIDPKNYKSDSEWLLRELLRSLSPKGGDTNMTNMNQKSDELINLLYEGIESIVQNSTDEIISSFLTTLVDVSLSHAHESRSMQVRQRALTCLTKLAGSKTSSDLLNLRSTVVEKLRPILEDKKRLVRQAAAEARLKWVLVGQPIG